jgi:hypothetical protein
MLVSPVDDLVACRSRNECLDGCRREGVAGTDRVDDLDIDPFGGPVAAVAVPQVRSRRTSSDTHPLRSEGEQCGGVTDRQVEELGDLDDFPFARFHHVRRSDHLGDDPGVDERLAQVDVGDLERLRAVDEPPPRGSGAFVAQRQRAEIENVVAGDRVGAVDRVPGDGWAIVNEWEVPSISMVVVPVGRTSSTSTNVESTPRSRRVSATASPSSSVPTLVIRYECQPNAARRAAT